MGVQYIPYNSAMTREEYYRAHDAPPAAPKPFVPPPTLKKGRGLYCGTNRGYNQHIANKTKRCDACLAAHAEHERERLTSSGERMYPPFRPTKW